MPIYGDVDVPLPAWCTVDDAINWLLYERPPLAPRHDGFRGGLDYRYQLGKAAPQRNDFEHFAAWCTIFEAVAQGKITLRGQPAIGRFKVIISAHPLMSQPNRIECEAWGPAEIILAPKVESAGPAAFLKIRLDQFMCDDLPGSTKVEMSREGSGSSSWAYSSIMVKVEELLRLFPTEESETYRIGTDVQFIRRDLSGQQAENLERDTAKEYKKYDWASAFVHVCAQIHIGQVDFQSATAIASCMEQWLNTQPKGAPGPGYLNKKAEIIRSAYAAADQSAESVKQRAKNKAEKS